MNYLFHIGVMLGIYGMLALSANLLIGFGGLLTMAQAAFYGLGAYAYALLSLKLGLPFFVTLPAAILLCALVGWLFGHAALRFRNEAFVLATIGFQMIVYVTLYNWTDLTRGPYGISGIPRPSFFTSTGLSASISTASCKSERRPDSSATICMARPPST